MRLAGKMVTDGTPLVFGNFGEPGLAMGYARSGPYKGVWRLDNVPEDVDPYPQMIAADATWVASSKERRLFAALDAAKLEWMPERVAKGTVMAGFSDNLTAIWHARHEDPAEGIGAIWPRYAIVLEPENLL